MVLSAPRIRRTAQNTQFTYNLQRRTFNVKTYPILSPQGATILIYGHENGLTIVWRGGRRLKAAKPITPAPHSKPKANGDDAGVMVLDSDDDEQASKPIIKKPFVDAPEFEDTFSHDPYPEITQTLDLSLGTAAIHISVLPLTPTRSADEGFFTGIETLSTHMVFAVTCGTNDVYLVTLPLTPPSHESKARPELRSGPFADKIGAGLWGENLTLLTGQLAPSRGVAMSLVKPKTGDKPTVKARVVIASHSPEASGALRLWETTLDDAKTQAAAPLDAFQTEFLSNSLSSISFNATHTSQLLAVQPQHGIRVYDFAASPFPADEVLSGPFPTQGSWQLSLFQPFTKGFPVRKPIVDAAWIASGRAILVLLADGTWGIWDVDGVSPKSSSLLGKNASGVVGGGVTTFAASGQIEGTNILRAGALDGKVSARIGTVAAMASSAFAPGKMSAVHGAISVSPIPGPLGSNSDESVALWIASWEHVCVIPGILRFWDSQIRRQSGGGVNLFAGSTPSRMIKIQELSTGLMGEKCTGICAVPIHPNLDGKDKDPEPTALGLPIEVAVLGESRLVLVRESDDKSVTNGGLVVRKRFGKRIYAAALVVDRPDKPKMMFNLNPGKAGTIRAPRVISGVGSTAGAPEGAGSGKEIVGSGASFPFMKTLTAAADEDEKATAGRDIEFEMLDIIEIDRQLDNLEDFRGGGHKRVMFEGGS